MSTLCALFPYWRSKEGNGIDLVRLWWGLIELTFAEHFEQCWAHGKHYVNASHYNLRVSGLLTAFPACCLLCPSSAQARPSPFWAPLTPTVCHRRGALPSLFWEGSQLPKVCGLACLHPPSSGSTCCYPLKLCPHWGITQSSITQGWKSNISTQPQAHVPGRFLPLPPQGELAAFPGTLPRRGLWKGEATSPLPSHPPPPLHTQRPGYKLFGSSQRISSCALKRKKRVIRTELLLCTRHQNRH